jgi:hypothetical protein
MAYTAEEIRMLLERHEVAVARRKRAISVWDWVANPQALDAEIDETTARLSEDERRTVANTLEAWIEAEERHTPR